MARGAILLARNPKLKHLVSVPQNVIATSFTKESLEAKIPGVSWPKVGKLTWRVDSNHIECEAKVDKLYRFITERVRNPNERLMVCTHQALTAVFKRLKAESKLSALKNLLLTIDEIHHSESMIFEENEEERILENKLGEIVGHFFKHDLRLDMFTATLMRSNLSDIIPSKYAEGADYAKYTRYMDEHLEELNFKGGVHIRFLICSPEEALKHVYNEDASMKTFVYLPPVGSWIMNRYRDKYSMLSRLQRVLRAKTLRTVDLVTEGDRDARKEVFLKSIGGDEPDLLWALNMCKEGFDWPNASRSVVIGPRGSMVDIIQTLGRLLRSGKKDRVEFNIVFPIAGKPDPEQVQEYLNIIIQSLIVEWCFSRPKVKNKREQEVIDHAFIENPSLGQKALQACITAGINSEGDVDAVKAIRKGLDRFDLNKIPTEDKDIMAPILSRMVASGLGGLGSTSGKVQLVKNVFGRVRTWGASFGYQHLREIRESQNRKGWLTEDQIWEVAKAWKERTGKWPSLETKGAIPELPRSTWIGVNAALRGGIRGLPSGSSLGALLASRGVLNHSSKVALTEDKIWKVAKAWKERTGKWPSQDTKGEIPELPGNTWIGVNAALRGGIRGLPGGSSLSVLLASRGVLNQGSKVALTEDQIWEVAQAWKERTGKWPTLITKGEIPELPGNTWGGVNAVLRFGHSGLRGGSSLGALLASKGVLNRSSRVALTEDKIWKVAKAWKERTGKWPTLITKGEIPELPGNTWIGVNAALSGGYRGLPGGSSLGALLASKGVLNRSSRVALTEDKIWKVAKAWEKRTGKWPTSDTKGEIPELPGPTWATLNAALRWGSRGFPGGSSLSALLASRGVWNQCSKITLTEDQVWKVVRAWKERTGKWPTLETKGEIPEFIGATWAGINKALRDGRRGLPGGITLSGLKEKLSKCE
jgi:hypothetical protein